ncbi:glyoxalase/Bleomycin resistance /Dioxygenase superfamily protein [Mycobacterium xenopi 4042]|uniref:Glyoxalase/Bleomycin resistance /Dioxygenase superfamily protein n=1 Tax=Mycobacterium xenopi 4042 TaxID=1299334 RepID=X8BER9_MYCXE|nr:glyoxalase/Bleomycin resistance /Dioxygenase superfamily protein [Mycobacterium xenopi 3993]EUA42632.1 glyoxalase/Bleomycin resistance /Dioxygenase superfamily protein [Mycobacterium xenopi 4042]
MSLHAGTPVQIAWVTADLDATEKALTSVLGVRKWVRLPEVHFASDSCRYRGRPADFVANISLSYLGDMQLELLEPVRGRTSIVTFCETADRACTTSASKRKPSSSSTRWSPRPANTEQPSRRRG